MCTFCILCTVCILYRVPVVPCFTLERQVYSNMSAIAFKLSFNLWCVFHGVQSNRCVTCCQYLCCSLFNLVFSMYMFEPCRTMCCAVSCRVLLNVVCVIRGGAWFVNTFVYLFYISRGVSVLCPVVVLWCVYPWCVRLVSCGGSMVYPWSCTRRSTRVLSFLIQMRSTVSVRVSYRALSLV